MTDRDQIPQEVRCPYCWSPAYRTGQHSVLVDAPGGILAIGAAHVRYTCRTCGQVSATGTGLRSGRLYLRRLPRRGARLT